MENTPSDDSLKVYVFRCKSCGAKMSFTPDTPNQSIGTVAYLAGAKHERESPGGNCFMGGAKSLVLIELKCSAGTVQDT